MAISVSYNGVVYSIPETGEESWGENVTTFLVAIPAGCLQKSGGSFTLTADVNFGANFGLLSKYFSTRTASPSTAGIVRLAVSDSVGWRNNANSGNLLLAVNGSNQLTFNGSAVIPGGITALTGDVTATGPGSVAATIAANAVTDAKFRQSAALSIVGNSTNSTANVADISAGTDNFVLRRSGTALAFGTLVNANIDASAAIAVSKLAALTASRAVVSDSSGFLSSATTTSTEIGYVNGVTSAIQTQLNAKVSASLTSAQIIVGNVSNVATAVAMSGDISITNAGVTAIGSNKVTLAMMATIATQTFLGRTTASTGNVEDLTATQATAILNAMVGDSGSGGTKGLVPAPAAGDASAAKFLKADGTWQAPAGVGTVTSVAMTVPTFLSIGGSPVTSSGTLAVTLSGTALPVLNGGTGVTTSTGSGNTVLSTSPTLVTPSLGTPTAIVLTNASGLLPAAFGTQSAGTYLGGPYSGSAANPTFKAFQPPTITTYTSGTGTFTTGAGVLYLRVRACGGGGGGAGSGSSGNTAGGTGGTTTFGTTLISCTGGVGADPASAAGGAGGTASLGSGPIGTPLTGGRGNGGDQALVNGPGGIGGTTIFGGAGGGGGNVLAGTAAAANTGAGGGGAGGGAAVGSQAGGGAGGAVDCLITSGLAATYSYAIGALGSAGGGGTGGSAGGAGGSGYIEVTSYYQ